MKIDKTQTSTSSINKRNPVNVVSIKQMLLSKCCDRKLQPLPYDVCELSPSAKIKAQSNRILSRCQKFTIADYKSLTKLEKAVLGEINPCAKQAAVDSVNVGLKVKEHLDARHGNGNYVFCCIGTSPSGIARVLEFAGVETKYLPISQLYLYDEDDKYHQFADKYPKYREFLEEQGLGAEKVSKSKKDYLFYDYIYSGRSLSVFKKLIGEYFGLNLPNVAVHSADYLCYSACAKKIDPPKYAVDYVDRYMKEQNICSLGGVPHLPLSHIDEIDECRKYESPDAKMFNFFVIDELAKKGLLKNNPRNRSSL